MRALVPMDPLAARSPHEMPDESLLVVQTILWELGMAPAGPSQFDPEPTIYICFGPEPLQLPKTLEIHARAAIAACSVARFGGIGEDHDWLFPGPIHGRPVTTSTMIRWLSAIGLEPAPARSTAMGQLAMQLPPVILARLTTFLRSPGDPEAAFCGGSGAEPNA
ncbi:hypothetical protein ASG92_20445 [Arthrobacter sp. Soil736]|nr:hypothetical protein ASG92_20445 [Arthrobacter sp. Soil736]